MSNPLHWLSCVYLRASALLCRSAREQEHSMRVWIGFIRGDAYVHEWTGEIAEESDIGQAIGNAVNAYTRSSGQPIWGTTIMVDKA